MIANECCISKGIGVSEKGLPSFDKALLEAGVGNYNLVKLSSILPAKCKWIEPKDLPTHLKEGSILPTAFSTISSNKKGEMITSTIGVGLPKDKDKVGVIMEYSVKNVDELMARATLHEMIVEAFDVRGWELEEIISDGISTVVEKEGVNYTTFACIAEW